MTATRILVACTISLLATAGLATDDLLQSLVDVEHEFGAKVAEEGIRDAFLAVLTDDGILFRPDPVNGKAWLGGGQAPPGLLVWEPVHAEVSRVGDLGYTTGPWRYEREGSPGMVFGEYLSIWGRQKDGSWKLVLDEGTDHPEPPESAWEPKIESSDRTSPSKEPAPYEVLDGTLLETDKRFAELVSTEGPEAAFEALAHPDIRLLRDGVLPVMGWSAAQKVLHGMAPLPQPTVSGMGLSVSGDLGYTYGTTQLTSAEPSTYVRVWRGDGNGGWKIVLDIYRKVFRPRRQSQSEDKTVD